MEKWRERRNVETGERQNKFINNLYKVIQCLQPEYTENDGLKVWFNKHRAIGHSGQVSLKF